MSNCFQLTKKGETGPMALNKIDELICKHLGEPVHPKFWCHSWYDSIGFRLATGVPLNGEDDKGRSMEKEFAYLLTEKPYAEDPRWAEFHAKIMKIVQFLRDNFTSDAWAEIGRR